MAQLDFKFGADIKSAMSSLDQIDRKIQGINKKGNVKVGSGGGFGGFGGLPSLSGMAQSMIGQLSPLTLAFGGVATAVAGATYAISHLKSTVAESIPAASEIEKFSVMFTPILGGADEAEKRIAELSAFAAKTPFELSGIAQASKTLQSLTKGSLATGAGLELVGDAAAQAGVGIEDMASTMGRAYSSLMSGRAAGESLQRLQELGLLSGEARNQIEKLQKEGAKGQQVWSVLSSELSKTKGSMALLSETYEGLQSTLRDNKKMSLATQGKPYLDAQKEVLKSNIESEKTHNRLIQDQLGLINDTAQSWKRAGLDIDAIGTVLDPMMTTAGNLIDRVGAGIMELTAGLARFGLSVASFGMTEVFLRQQDEMNRSISEGEKLKATYDAKVAEREGQKRLAQEAELQRLEDLKESYKKLNEEITKKYQGFSEKFNESTLGVDGNTQKKLIESGLSNLFAGGFENANVQEVEVAIKKLGDEMQRLSELAKNSPGMFGEAEKIRFNIGIELLDRIIAKKKAIQDADNKREKQEVGLEQYRQEIALLEKKNALKELERTANLTLEQEWEKTDLEQSITAQEKLVAIEQEKVKLKEQFNLSEKEALDLATQRYNLEAQNKNLNSQKNKTSGKVNNIALEMMNALRNVSTSSFGRVGSGFSGLAPTLNVASQLQARSQQESLRNQATTNSLLGSLNKTATTISNNIGKSQALFA